MAKAARFGNTLLDRSTVSCPEMTAPSAPVVPRYTATTVDAETELALFPPVSGG